MKLINLYSNLVNFSSVNEQKMSKRGDLPEIISIKSSDAS
jgi:hypothetical protein